MILRNIGGSFIAASITVWLFLLMRYLILPGDDIPTKPTPGTSITLSRQERPEQSKPRERNVPPPPVQQSTPPPPLLTLGDRPDDGGQGIEIMPPPITSDTGDVVFEAPSDRRAIAVVKFPPQYPRGPLSRNIEGWVLLEFTITIAGTVEDLRVLDAEPPNVFDKSALSAVKRWKYRPKMENGKPVPQYRMQELITYVIED